LCLLLAVNFLVLGRKYFILFNYYSVFGMALMIAVLAWYARRRPKAGLWVLAGFVVLTTSVMLPVLRNLGYLPVNFATRYGAQIGGALEIPLVLIGLYFRSRDRRDNRLRLQTMSRADPLTGLANHRVLVDHLELLLRRAQGDAQFGAVLRVRVGNLDAIRNEHGREAAEAALLRAAECVARQASQSDTVGREQGGDLVLVMEGQVPRELAAAAGRNIIARGLKFSGQLPPGVTVWLHVAAACAPLPVGNAANLLGVLDQELDRIAGDRSGRALRIVGAADPSAIARGGSEMALSASTL
jgi:two-component system, sensor histidine kinase LadS